MYRAGDCFGEHEIVAPLRSGGMAMIFLARRAGASGFVRYVALKVLRPELATSGYVPALFAREALLLSRIDHPNVVRVETFGEASGAQYLVMELVHGATLAELLIALRASSSMLSVEHAVFVAAAIADGAHAAHEMRLPDGTLAGVVHRDISPQNVMIASTGHPKLIDFGVARARLDAQQAPTAPGPIGKARYMSPEQSRGDELDRRSDVYALGVVLLEMLLGHEAPTDPSARVEAARDLAARRPDTSTSTTDAVGRVLAHALAPSPADRTESAAALRNELFAACPAGARVGASELAALLASQPGLVVDPRENVREREAPVGDTSLEATLAPAAERPRAPVRRASAAPLLVIAVGIAGLVAWWASAAPRLAPDTAPAAPRVDVAPDAGAVVAAPPVVEHQIVSSPAVPDVPARRTARPPPDRELPLHSDPGY